MTPSWKKDDISLYFTELCGKPPLANPGPSNDYLWWLLNQESLYSTWEWCGQTCSALGRKREDPCKETRKQLVGVGTGLRMLPILHLLEMQRVNFKVSIQVLCLFISLHPQHARHSASFQEYNADQGRSGPCSDGPQKVACETAGTPYQMII